MRDRRSASPPSHRRPSCNDYVTRHARAALPVFSDVATAGEITQFRSYDKPADIASRLRIAEYEKAMVKANAPPMPSLPTRKRVFDEVDKDDAKLKIGSSTRDVPGPRLGNEDMAAHEEEMKREREQRRATVHSLLRGASKLTTMPLVAVPQEPVALVVSRESAAGEPKSSNSELLQTQSTERHQKDVTSVDDDAQVEVIAKPTRKDEATDTTFRDSGCFLAYDEEDADADDEGTDFDADMNVDDSCFVPVDQINTTDDDSQDTPAQPVQLPGQSKGKSKKLFLESGDEGFIEPTDEPVTKPSGERWDGMLRTFTADMNFPLGSSTSSKRNVTSANEDPVIAGDADEPAESLQRALLESLQPTSGSGIIQSPHLTTNEATKNTENKKAVANKVIDDKTFSQADKLGGLAIFLAYDSAEESEDDDSEDEDEKKHAPPIHLPHNMFEEKLNMVIADLLERYQACRIAYMSLDTIDIESHLSQFSQMQRHRHVKAFIHDNLVHFTLYKPVVNLKKDVDGKTREYKSLGAAWHDMGERVKLCGALKWVFALLKSSHPAEDENILKPRMVGLLDEEKLLEAAQKPLDKFAPSLELEMNDDQWQKYHEKCHTIKTSNNKRNELLQNTGLSIDMFDNILTSVELLTVDLSDGFEDESIAVLKNVLRQIVDIIRFDNCSYLLEQTGPLQPTQQTKEQLRYTDGGVKLAFPDELVRLPFVDRSKEKQRAVHFLTKKWKTSFPPNIWRDVSNLKVFYDLDGGFNETLATKRMAVLTELTVSDLCEWISVYKSRLDFLGEWTVAIQTELSRIISTTAHERVKAHEDLKEKQLWFRNYSILFLRRLRKIIKTWIRLHNNGSDNIESEEIATFMQLLENSELALKAIQQDPPVTFPWVIGDFCNKINRPGGCPLHSEGLCIYEHSSEICTWGKQCRFGDKCHKIHPEGAETGKVLTKIVIPTQGMARSASPAHTPATATGPCPYVNKPAGCQGSQRDACPFAHFNENKECKIHKSKEGCSYGERCAFLHSKAAATATPLSEAGTRRFDKNENLEPLLDQVLADPKRFRDCMWVNKPPVGCRSGAGCIYNHSLSGVECPDGLDRCTRGVDCPLFHGLHQSTSQRPRSVTPQTRVATVQNSATGLKRSHDTYAADQGAAAKMISKRLRQDEVPQGAPTGPQRNGQQLWDARLNGQRLLLQVPAQQWPAYGQQSQGPQAPFNAPKGLRTGGTQSPLTPRSPLNALQAAGPLTLSGQKPRGPAQPQLSKQQQKAQPPPNAPKGPRDQQVLYQAPQARVTGQQMQRKAIASPVAFHPTIGFRIRGAAGPNQHSHSHQPAGQKRMRDDDVDMMDVDSETDTDAQEAKRTKHYIGKKQNRNHGCKR
jgi:hypothetical protein